MFALNPAAILMADAGRRLPMADLGPDLAERTRQLSVQR